jgi:hypothetical protein
MLVVVVVEEGGDIRQRRTYLSWEALARVMSLSVDVKSRPLIQSSWPLRIVALVKERFVRGEV